MLSRKNLLSSSVKQRKRNRDYWFHPHTGMDEIMHHSHPWLVFVYIATAYHSHLVLWTWTTWHLDPAWPQCSPGQREGEGRGLEGEKDWGRVKKERGERRWCVGSKHRDNVILPRLPLQALCLQHTQTKHEHHQPTHRCTLCLTVCTQVYSCSDSSHKSYIHPVPLHVLASP